MLTGGGLTVFDPQKRMQSRTRVLTFKIVSFYTAL